MRNLFLKWSAAYSVIETWVRSFGLDHISSAGIIGVIVLVLYYSLASYLFWFTAGLTAGWLLCTKFFALTKDVI